MGSRRSNRYAVGAKVEYQPTFDEQVRRLRLLGLPPHKIASYFGVKTETLKSWCADHESFAVAWDEGGEEADGEVARALYDRATGRAVVQGHKVFVIDGMVEKVEIEKHYPPDVNAAKAWLASRHPENWRDKQEHHHSGEVKTTIDPSKLSDEALQELLDARGEPEK